MIGRRCVCILCCSASEPRVLLLLLVLGGAGGAAAVGGGDYQLSHSHSPCCRMQRPIRVSPYVVYQVCSCCSVYRDTVVDHLQWSCVCVCVEMKQHLLNSQRCARVAAVDSCTEACQQAVCTTMHQVPAWNEACITRCSTECQRGRAS